MSEEFDFESNQKDERFLNEILSSTAFSVDFKEDFNTRFIINALTKWKVYNYDEIKFRISETSLLQFLGILSSLIKDDEKQGLRLSKEKIELFFIFKNDKYIPYPSIENVELNCRSNYPSNDKETEIFKACINSIIRTLNAKITKSSKRELYYFENAFWGNFYSPTSNLGKISILEFLKKSLIYKIEFCQYLRDWEYKINDNNSFNLKISEKNLERLYETLTPDFIDNQKTGVKDFINVLSESWEVSQISDSIINLKMDHYQTYLFWEWFCQKYQVKWTLQDIEKSKLLKNTSSKTGFFSADTISNSYRRPRKRDKEDEDKLLKKKLNRV